MCLIEAAAREHCERVHKAREVFFGGGEAPAKLLDTTVLRSWERCRDWGLSPSGAVEVEVAGSAVLNEQRERNRNLLALAAPTMEYVYEQIRDSGSMVLLADANGLLLHAIGDAEFVDRAGRVALQPGVSWEEMLRGTNAIGTALVEERSVEVYGAEHFLERNGFLTCSAVPLFDSQGRLVGVLDISGDHRAYQRHTMGLVRMSARIMEKDLFKSEHAGDILLGFHSRRECLEGLGEGVIAVSPDGRVQAINQAGLDLLGVQRREAVQRDFSVLFETSLGELADRFRRNPNAEGIAANLEGQQFHVRLSGKLPWSTSVGGVVVDAHSQARRGRACGGAANDRPDCELTLDTLCTGDPQLRVAVDKARRVLGRDIPILIEGESGAGKELFAKAFHNSGVRREGPFVALNCAAIPEALIESELFGYLGGAFTGARKEGAMGKIQQAHGGTLFLDEIGDMPLNLQARLLRVLQERTVTPLGSSKAIPVDISLVCATHRRLKEEIVRGNFRTDLYYRLNGLSVTVPALRERTDLRELVDKLICAEAGPDSGITVSEGAMRAFERYSWPGNIRQLSNVLRVAIALLSDESVISEWHLPEDLAEVGCDTAAPQATGRWSSGDLPTSLDEIEQAAIQRIVDLEGGNISAAARKLGISRNTVYRKIGRL